MSLQVWLPLNGSLKNQGLKQYNLSMFRGSEVYNNNGKIGKCFYANGVNTIKILNIIPDFYNYSAYSLCAWVYIEAQNTSHTGCGIISAGNWNSQVLNLGLSDWSTNHYTRLRISGTNWSRTYTYNFSLNTWYHIVVSSDSNKTYAYVNGVLIGDSQTSFLPTSIEGNDICIGGATYYAGMQFFGRINDVRIYDHALSNKEVEEIAKGLILHYKLDDSYAETTTMLSSSITTTAYNSSLGKYGYNTDSNLGKVDGLFQGKQCTKVYTLTPGQTAQPYAYFGNLFTSDGTNQPAYKTLSFDYYTTVPTTTWLNIYKLGSGTGTATWKTSNSDGIKTGTYTNSSNSISVKPNEWNHIEVIFHGTTAANAEWGYCINGPAHTTNENYYFLYANIQLEENDHATGYGNNFHQSIIYDSSGYNNNGTIIGEIELNNDSPRYTVVTYINSPDPTTNSATGEYYISADCGLVTPTEISIAWWANPESGYGGSISHAMWSTTANDIASDYQVSAFNHRDTRFDVNSSDGQHLALSTSSFIANAWHHYVVTYNGQTAKLYKDGVQQTSVAFTATKSLGTFTKILIGHSRAGGVHRKMKGKYSDFRVYATALTENQIQELYHTSATIDNVGNIYAREIIE